MVLSLEILGIVYLQHHAILQHSIELSLDLWQIYGIIYIYQSNETQRQQDADVIILTYNKGGDMIRRRSKPSITDGQDVLRCLLGERLPSMTNEIYSAMHQEVYLEMELKEKQSGCINE